MNITFMEVLSMKQKVLIISDSQQFIEYTKQLINTSKFSVSIISVAKRLIDSEKYFKEYLHDVVIIDIDTQNGLLGKSVEKIKSYASNSYILCVENDISLTNMRSMFKTGVDDYLSIQEFDGSEIDKAFGYLNNQIDSGFEIEEDFELEHQLGLLRDGQVYQEPVIHQHMKPIYDKVTPSKQMVFFRIDNIAWIYQHVVKDRLLFKAKLEKILRTQINKKDVVFFSKKHSGFIVADNITKHLLKNYQRLIKDELEMSISFVMTQSPLVEESFISVYNQVLQLIDSSFYLNDGIILDLSSCNSNFKLRELKDLPNNFPIDIQYRFRKKDYLNSDYFISKSLEFIESNKIGKNDSLEFYSHMYQRIVQEQFHSSEETILELKEQIRLIYMVNKFEDLKLRVLIINELIKARLIEMESEKSNPYISSIYDYIDNNMEKKISLKQLSEHLGITEIYISRLFKEEIGTNLFTKINQIKMERASELLQEGVLSISETALKVGFSDSLYFSRVFKNHHGASPSKYRQVRRKV